MSLPRVGTPRAPSALLTFAALLVIFFLASGSSVALADNPFCSHKTMAIVAHQDDDLLFQSPDLLETIAAGACVRTVFLTAGDAGLGATYWHEREEGSRAAYALMAGVPDTWSNSEESFAGHSLHVATLAGNPGLSEVYMRLPNGGRSGAGYPATGRVSLPKLWRSHNPQPASLTPINELSALDGSATYTYEGLLATLKALVLDFEPDVILTQDVAEEFDASDHDDHIVTARLAKLTDGSYPAEHLLRSYMDYRTAEEPVNVAGPQLARKTQVFNAYRTHDKQICVSEAECQFPDPDYNEWLKRQIVVAETAVPGADAGADQAVASKAAVTLDGSGSSDPLGHTLTYNWVQTGGPAVTLSNSHAVKPTFTAPSGPATLTFSLVVNNSQANSRAQTVTVVVAAPFFLLKVAKSGNGSGIVASAPAGISCPSDCEEAYEQGTRVTLTPSPAAGSEFKGWSGACAGSGACEVTMTAARSVGAEFALQRHQLSVTKAGTGAGTVTSAPAGISCGASCSASFDHGVEVTLSAAPAAGSSFVRWTGACTGSGSCKVAMSAAKAVGAEFALVPNFALSLTASGNGSGIVASAPAGISCPSDCEEAYEQGTRVTLTPSPAAGSEFKGWSGACAGSGACEVTMTAARSVGAEFALQRHQLSVTKAGTGAGTVTSAPAGISCGASCSASFDHGVEVTLSAAPAAGSKPAVWAGCNHVNDADECEVAMNAAKGVIATFPSIDHNPLTVTRSGSGTGDIASTPAGINCGTQCSSEYVEGTLVTLSGASGAHSNAVFWETCPGTVNASDQCEVLMSQARNAIARFDLEQHTLTVIKGDLRVGPVTSVPVRISCGSRCTASFEHGTVATLIATAGVSEISWSGCNEIVDGDQCRVAMVADREVSAIATPPSTPPAPAPTAVPVPAPGTTPEPPAAPGTRLLRAKVGPGTAKFVFAAEGSATRFRCALTRLGHEVRYKQCSSPITYRYLEPGPYVFKVKAVGPGGADPQPVTKRLLVPAFPAGRWVLDRR
jgi:LmbE family N-acetylglucosaminyl deacetylase